MSCYSFFDGTYDKSSAIELINRANKKFYRRYGFAYKGAEKVPSTKEALIAILNRDSMVDVYDETDYVLVNQYSDNDMW